MEFLHQTEHRPWPLPDAPWVMFQIWNHLLFAHWPLPPAVLREHLPPTLPLDTFDGSAWIGIVPFWMSDVRPRWLPPVPWLSVFPELNVRTYVRVEDKPGVYFFSLEAANPVAVRLARWFYYLPYYDAQMKCHVDSHETVTYDSRRTHRGARPAELHMSYQPTGAVFHATLNSLEGWLTERYCLYTTNRRGDLLRGEIHHLPWPLQPAEADFLVNTMTHPLDMLLPDIPPLLHYSQRQEMVAWALQRVL